MDKVVRIIQSMLGPSPLLSACMVVTTILAILTALKVTPSIPPSLGYLVLGLLVASANLYLGFSVVRVWPRVVGGVDGRWQMRPPSKPSFLLP